MSLTERQEYARQIKKAIEVGLQLKEAMEGFDLDTTQIKESIKILKDKFTNFDVYQQKRTYSHRCPTCYEFECVCDEMNPKPAAEPVKPKDEDEEFKEKIEKLF